LSNRDIHAAWRYHNSTKHSWHSVHTTAYYLDWNNQPMPFKAYPRLEGEKLPTDLQSSEMPALTALVAPSIWAEEYMPNRSDLAVLFYYAAGITKRGIVPGGQMYFRAAACTGALYHIELYLVCGDLPDLPAGVYHFGPHDFSLRQLREGDYRSALVEASGQEPAVAQAPAIIVTTSVYWRNAWKYQARAYRHAYWDSGTILANLLATGNAHHIPLKIVTAFVDGGVNRLLDLDDQRETALQLVPVGVAPGQSVPPAPEVTPLNLETTPYSRREVDYAAIREMHTASSLVSPQEAQNLWGITPAIERCDPQGQLFPLDPAPEAELPDNTIEAVIARRGSSRHFRRAPITYQQLSVMLDRAIQDIPADFLDETDATLNQLYLIVHDVEGLPSGSYVFHPQRVALEQLKAGDFREQAGYLGLQQALPADASVDIFFLTGLAPVLERYGNRGYRMAQLEASIRGGKLYLGAYAQHLGATGLTFFDDDVTEFFAPHAQGKSVMFLVALGRPLSRRRGRGYMPAQLLWRGLTDV
jgi:SagB-type dehydrogenase family enzyme